MSLFNIFNISGSALETQSKKMDVHAKNLANSDSYIYKNGTLYPYVARIPMLQFDPISENNVGGVKMHTVAGDTSSLKSIYNPNSPIADSNGYSKVSNVDIMSETINAITASKNYQTNLEILNTTKNMIMKTLTIGQ
ncbi:flagellar basal-body rod protein FlgC [Buchnera aphidicola str. Bp (Baizongia pistaciae)]|uniref:Flagellar basal-body rod protein FlgC n=1 Tax=Buchnera aphidicola subsp. Baizongia pistaciae (strain Bp) TaxID=224915 RepID=FLGC_BUCBP|nr:flagellar basal body rod protein FlgC [Buchnera aphidicola]Q89AH9.1 RecName: Full=Flagellar basal-body rod protein FlgC [Buchnera aphidicola str. Bp (Baizongia pistaciae)]AAO27033.1 flagellar basal-body rod protein FlgC [Buchnera aphidicola str. Bp (Baizongia pistaciae)]